MRFRPTLLAVLSGGILGMAVAPPMWFALKKDAWLSRYGAPGPETSPEARLMAGPKIMRDGASEAEVKRALSMLRRVTSHARAGEAPFSVTCQDWRQYSPGLPCDGVAFLRQLDVDREVDQLWIKSERPASSPTLDGVERIYQFATRTHPMRGCTHLQEATVDISSGQLPSDPTGRDHPITVQVGLHVIC